MSDIVERLRGTATHLESGEPGRAVEISYADMREAAAEIEHLRTRLTDAYAALRSIAEGNLGDAAWQVDYETIKLVARNALISSLPSTENNCG